MLEYCKTQTNRKRLKKLESVARTAADFSEISESSTGISAEGDRLESFEALRIDYNRLCRRARIGMAKVLMLTRLPGASRLRSALEENVPNRMSVRALFALSSASLGKRSPSSHP